MRRRLLILVTGVVALVAAGCDLRLTPPPGEGLVRYRDPVFATVTKTADITYGSAPHQITGETVTLKLDLYQPDGDTVTARPVIVLVHGGTFRSGNKTSPELVDQANVYAKEGYVVASIDYRLSPNGCSTPNAECVGAIVNAKNDAQAAVRFLRSKAADYGLDASRFAMAGSSAGAITAIEVAYGSEQVGSSGTPGYDSTIKAAVSLSGSMVLTTPSAGDGGVLLLHGTADTVVPYQAALNTQTAAQNAGTYVEMTAWTGDGHVPYVAHRDEILTQTSNFLWWQLNLSKAAH